MRLAFPGLLDALSEGATIVTPTPLLSSAAIEQFNRAQMALGHESWERPAIFSLDTWMAKCWEHARFIVPNTASLLSPSQERELWRQIVERDRPDLFDVRAMASIAQRAARIVAEYDIPLEGAAWVEHIDAQSFARWHNTLRQQLRAENWMVRADLWRLIPDWISRGVVKRNEAVFAALTAVSPGLKRLQQRNVGITPSYVARKAQAVCYDSTAYEMEQTARAVRYLLETGHTESIGVLVVDFPSLSRDLIRTFNNVFYPSAEDTGHIHAQAGDLLGNTLISNALLLLDLVQSRISHSAVGAILRSPFIEGAAKERSARAAANYKLRRQRELDFSLSDIDAVCGMSPIMSRIIRRVRAVNSKMLSLMRLSDWSETFSNILEAAKWPTLEDMTQSEQKAVEQWKNALSELASLGLVSPPVTLSQALTQLRAMLGRPSEQGDWSSPIQILDARFSEGIEFDQVFVMNARETVWPPPLELSPLIPYQLQRAQQVPGSHAESAAELRSRKTSALFTSGRQVNVSFTGTLAPSLKSFVELVSNVSPVWTGKTAAEAYEPAELESQEDSRAPQLMQTGKTIGGSGILKSQSLCPFKAFAEYRLNARGEDDASFGFDALERGTFAHKALQHIWESLKSQLALKALSAADLAAMVEECVSKAVTDDGSGPIRSLISEAERERLAEVISNWLVIERDRPEPFTVEQVEQKLDVELAGLKLELRADRIDRVRDGSLVLIDYKTGKQSKTKLETERPTEPQLLVYAAVVNEPVSGLYFAELRNEGVRAVGHGNGKHFAGQRGIKDHKSGWVDFVESSQKTVERLANEFMQGGAAVDPTKSACAYCRVKPICRIGAAANAEDDEEW